MVRATQTVLSVFCDSRHVSFFFILLSSLLSVTLKRERVFLREHLKINLVNNQIAFLPGEPRALVAHQASHSDPLQPRPSDELRCTVLLNSPHLAVAT